MVTPAITHENMEEAKWNINPDTKLSGIGNVLYRNVCHTFFEALCDGFSCTTISLLVYLDIIRKKEI